MKIQMCFPFIRKISKTTTKVNNSKCRMYMYRYDVHIHKFLENFQLMKIHTSDILLQHNHSSHNIVSDELEI